MNLAFSKLDGRREQFFRKSEDPKSESQKLKLKRYAQKITSPKKKIENKKRYKLHW